MPDVFHPPGMSEPNRRPLAWARLLGLIGVGLFFASAFSPLPNVLSQRLATPPRLEPADAIVVLGGGIRPDGTLSNPSLRRALHGVTLYRTGLAPLLVFLGAPRDDQPEEANARARLARSLGLPAGAILEVTGAWTTREEAAHVRARLAARGIHRILLVTDSQHMARAEPLFERAGFEVLPAPADEVSDSEDAPEARLKLMRRVLEEILARLYYRAAGYL